MGRQRWPVGVCCGKAGARCAGAGELGLFLCRRDSAHHAPAGDRRDGRPAAASIGWSRQLDAEVRRAAHLATEAARWSRRQDARLRPISWRDRAGARHRRRPLRPRARAQPKQGAALPCSRACSACGALVGFAQLRAYFARALFGADVPGHRSRPSSSSRSRRVCKTTWMTRGADGSSPCATCAPRPAFWLGLAVNLNGDAADETRAGAPDRDGPVSERFWSRWCWRG